MNEKKNFSKIFFWKIFKFYEIHEIFLSYVIKNEATCKVTV